MGSCCFCYSCVYFVIGRTILSKIKRHICTKTKGRYTDVGQESNRRIGSSQLHEEEFVGSPKVKIRSTKNKINVHVKGDLKRTSSLVGKTSALMREIEQKVRNVLGTEQNIGVAVTYSGYEEQNTRDNKHSRVE